MNLLRDSWIPVRDEKGFRHLSYRAFLCEENDRLEFGLNRDDFNLATLQLLISLTQVIFTPENASEVRRREKTPLTDAEFEAGIAPYLDWFELRHLETPFMQSRGVNAKDPTPIQKLFPGLPEGNNHAMFNGTDEVSAACESCVAIALFNQAMNCPSLGGGFKGSLRGSVPINTFVKGPNERRTVWRNVLSAEWLDDYPPRDANDVPTWVKPIHSEEKIPAGSVGLLRGLFWQPMRLEVIGWQPGDCPVCGGTEFSLASGFLKEKFNFSVVGTWRHPHGPRQWKDKGAGLEERYGSFTTKAPAWTQLAAMVADGPKEQKEGSAPALVVAHFNRAFDPLEPLDLIVGGYRNNQAAITDRRHELFSLAHEWKDRVDVLRAIIAEALEVKDVLRKKTYGFGKNVGVPGLAERAEEAFFHRSEPSIHRILREMEWDEIPAVRSELTRTLCGQARAIFEDVTEPYRTDPKMLKTLTISRRSLERDLKKFTQGEQA